MRKNYFSFQIKILDYSDTLIIVCFFIKFSSNPLLKPSNNKVPFQAIETSPLLQVKPGSKISVLLFERRN